MRFTLIILTLLCLGAGLQAQSTEGVISTGAVTPIYSNTGGLHFIKFDWLPDNNDPFAITGTLTSGGATPGGAAIMIASLAGVDELAFGFLPVLVDLDPANISSYYYFGHDALGSLTVTNVSRSIPALVGMQMHIQVFEYSPLLLASNSLRFDIAP